jgi:acyl carrier protein
MAMTRDEVLIWLRGQLVEVLEVEPDEVQEDTDLAEDLDADSIDLIEVINNLERETKITIEEEELYDIATVGQLLDIVERHQARAG